MIYLLVPFVALLMGLIVTFRVKPEEPEYYRIIGLVAGLIAGFVVWLIITFMW